MGKACSVCFFLVIVSNITEGIRNDHAGSSTQPNGQSRYPTSRLGLNGNEVIAVVNLVEANDSGITGKLFLTQPSPTENVTITGILTNVPAGFHGFHVHENGATTDNCADAGGHFNPLNKDHGSPDSDTRHVGDLGNIVSTDSEGLTRIFITDSIITMQQDNIANILNRAIVIHEDVDDFAGESGNAGSRISCGIISDAIHHVNI